MALHRLTGITLGVPRLAETRAFYRDFGLAETSSATFSTSDGGEQLRLVEAPHRRLLEMRLAVEDADDLGAMQRRIAALGLEARLEAAQLTALDPISGVRVVAETAPPLQQVAGAARVINAPGATLRHNARSSAVLAPDAPRPRRLGHVVVGSPDAELTRRFFVDGVGFKVSDLLGDVGAAFLRCSSDHHNLLVQPAPVSFLHHTAWEMADVDEVGLAAARMVEARPDCHAWGLGRHGFGSNFFWYLRDPSGGFNEYYSDLDVIVDDELWKVTASTQIHPLAAWGPPVPMEFLLPTDLLQM
ncbi:MAG TPA: VOC family protein [Reyranella sp.]|nr:VOC family protein [Candidatus Binatia bacterium]HYD07876.1 VOC family protein [Reyranella sp.]